MSPVAVLFLVGVATLVGGFVGGLGGRRFMLRQQLAELWEAVGALQEQLNRKRGRELTDVRLARGGAPKPGDARALGLLARLVGAPGVAGPPDELAMQRGAAEHFRKKDKESAG